MKCFNHTEREAVATCQRCGKGLCRECAEKYTPCMCDICAAQTRQEQQQQDKSKEEQRKQKYKDALVDTRSEFIKTAVMGVIVGIFFVWWCFSNEEAGAKSGFLVYAGLFFVAFCIPFGWKFLTYLQSFIPFILFGTLWFWFIYMIIKVVLSLIVGVPAFIYQLIKTIVKTTLTQNKINKM